MKDELKSSAFAELRRGRLVLTRVMKVMNLSVTSAVKAESNPTQSESHRVAPSHSDLKRDSALSPVGHHRMFALISASRAGLTTP